MTKSWQRWLGRYVFRYHLGVEVISIHIPKTAGTSFKEVLQSNFDQDNILFAYGSLTRPYWERSNMFLDRPIKLIHGHFPASIALKKSYPNAKLIAWIRNPIDRVTSYYHYWKTKQPHGNANHIAFLESNMGILEFAQQPYIRNELREYFGDLKLEEFFFIGLTEHFEQDIMELSKIMEWRVNEIPQKNVSRKSSIDQETRRKLEEVLVSEMELYRKVLKLRQQQVLGRLDN